MGWFSSPPPVIAPEVQREIAHAAHERLGVAVSLIQSSVITPNSRPDSVVQLVQRLRTELGLVASSNVEKSPIYIDGKGPYQQDVGNRLKMIRAFLEGAARKAQDPLLLQPGVNSDKKAVTDDIHEDFVQVLRNIRALESLLKKSEERRAA